MDRLHAMEVFVRVIETGSFSAAARDMRIGQPAVSKLIAALEDRLQVRLLVRSTRHLHPSEAGQAFYERARRTLAEADEADSAARGEGAGIEGRLRVCSSVTFARLHVVPRIGAFMEAHPNLRLDLVMDDRYVDLLEENIDVALRAGELSNSSLTARRLATCDRHVVASPAYLARMGTPSTPIDLLAHSAIVYTQGLVAEEWRFRRGTADTSVRIPTRLSCSAAEGVREAVVAGLGLAISSVWMMEPELASGTVLPVLTEWRLPTADLWALYPSGKLPTAKARAFVDWFAECFSTN
ncbi:LysR family transcriptional regulator [Lichenifustis flavocetrariae]|uniref:LysR family transcriptional regulator n=1 Tax=Lichenifustis flavocetrariae TaxID=2949735 RepID=A0AA42CMG0_9HYPH|nr:LysR family transcriptional regulator [Lichenifustis flavocetrariae]MCW6512513.1 LysR family transcriptional regulator [Lichenifustis flavocetrariae]